PQAGHVPLPPPLPPRRPSDLATAPRTTAPDLCHAITPVPGTHHQTDASARCEFPSSAQAPSAARCHHQIIALVPARRSNDAPVRALPAGHAHRVPRVAPRSVESPVDRLARCAPASNSDESSRPSCESCGASTWTAITTENHPKENTQSRHYIDKSARNSVQVPDLFTQRPLKGSETEP